MNRKSKVVLAISAIALMIGITVAPVAANAATSSLFNRQAGLGDLFVLDMLFNGSQSGGVLSSGGVNLGDLFILDQLFPIQTAAAAPVSLASQMSGRILLQVQQQGQAWYVNPATLSRVSLGDPSHAFQVMSQMAVGISNSDFDKLSTAVPASLKGRFILKTEDQGKLYYVNPVNNAIIYVSGPSGAADLIAGVGLGITDSNLSKIPVMQ